MADPSLPLRALADVLDRAAAVPGKLEKTRLVAELLATLGDADLPRATRWPAGRPFARSDGKVLGVSGAILTDALLPRLGVDYDAYRRETIARGEIGEAVRALWPAAPTGDANPITLADVAALFDRLASDNSRDAKAAHLAAALARPLDAVEAAYLCKFVLGDLRTGVREGVLLPAVAQAFGRAEPDVRRALLLTGDLGQTALLAKRDALADAKLTLFAPVQFMLATPIESEDGGVGSESGTSLRARLDEFPGRWRAEPKLDGIRAQAHVSGRRVELYSRTLDRNDGSFPDVAQALARLPVESCVLDGELVVYERGRPMPFARLQRRLGRKLDVEKIALQHPCVLVAFDVLELDGEPLIDRPVGERRALLEDLARREQGIPGLPPFVLIEQVPVTTVEDVEALFAQQRDAGYEGLILKDVQSTYAVGRRGAAWLKVKTHLPTLDCVVTAAERGHGRRRKFLSDYTFAVWTADPADGGQLQNVGKAFSGLTDAEMAELTELFLSISTANDGRVFQVPPRVVMEIGFEAVQKSARHKGGFALRFPRIKRVRDDKRPEDADRLARVAEIWASAGNLNRHEGEAEEPEPPRAEPQGLLF